MVCEKIEMAVLAGVGQAALLLKVFFFRPIELTAADRLGIRAIQKDQDIGIGNALPHVRNIRMFLGDVAQLNGVGFQAVDEGRFS